VALACAAVVCYGLVSSFAISEIKQPLRCRVAVRSVSMFEEHGKVSGHLEVRRDTRLYGSVSGDVTVKPGRTLVVHGVIEGSLFLEEESSAHVYGAIFGDVVNTGGKLRVWNTGTVRGIVDHGSATRIEGGATVGALAPNESDASAAAESESLKGLRVLVVEDDEATREAIVALLDSCGARPLAASQGEEALEVFHRERPDAIVADLWMPKVDGYDLIRRVRSLPSAEGGLTPAIAMTASTSDLPERALRTGFHAHFAKPFNPSRFVETVRSLVRHDG
jgi:CheY-like chemotaxis protein